MDHKSQDHRARPGTFTIVLATIGGLALLTFLFFVITTISLVRSGSSKVTVTSGECVGVVTVTDVIADPSAPLDAIRQFSRDDDVKAVVLRIDSPGGAVGASQEIFQAARRLDTIKPVVASMGNVAASGGFYAAMGARYVMANPGTVTGSIGVIMQIPNIQELLKKVGVKTTVLKSGKLKDLASVTRDLTLEERQVLQAVMDDVHRQFMEDVAEARKIPVDEIAPIADGRIFSGRQALELGLVDQLGGFDQAVEKAAELAGMEGPIELCQPEEDKLMVLKRLLEESGARMLFRLSRLLSQSADAPVPH